MRPSDVGDLLRRSAGVEAPDQWRFDSDHHTTTREVDNLSPAEPLTRERMLARALARPADDEYRQGRDEDGAAQQGCDAVDDALVLRGVGVVLGVEPGDRLDRLFDMDRKDRRGGVQVRH